MGLNSMYDSVLERINSQEGDCSLLAKRAITWLVYASRSLKITELMHTVAIEGEELSFNEGDIPRQNLIVLVSCGMIEIEQESGVVRLVRECSYA